MKEQPIERLNYFDGQRLQASDFRLEQEFHIRIQRWLTRSLFTPGIADGLEVVRKPETRNTIFVQPGLAIDDLGRAIILVEPEELVVTARFLTARYDEQKTAALTDGCGGPGDDRALRWGGPSRIVSRPRFCFRDQIPRDATRELVIAELEIGPECEIRHILGGSRRYAGVAQTSRTRGIALEGEKDISDRAPKELRFHIRGRRPEAVTLYLRGGLFSRTFYTELGGHSHGSTIDGTDGRARTDPALEVDAHTHSHHLGTVTQEPSRHRATAPLMPQLDPEPRQLSAGEIFAGIVTLGGSLIGSAIASALWTSEAKSYQPAEEQPPYALRVITHAPRPEGQEDRRNLNAEVALSISEVSQSVTGTVGPEAFPSSPGRLHTHTFAGSIDSAGAGEVEAASNALSYFADLQVLLGEKDITEAIVAQAQREHPDQTWAGKLGDATGTHPIVTHGTGPIRLDFIEGVDLVDGEYTLTFLLPEGTRNGGKLLYNLYVD